MLPDGVPSSQAFLVCYDADSRPPLDSLARFTRAIDGHPGADVFHQSSRFELRASSRPPGRCAALRAAVCDAGALRANRFVLGFELPRLLNRSGQVSALKRALCSGVYAHVTGHGLCVAAVAAGRAAVPGPLAAGGHALQLHPRLTRPAHGPGTQPGFRRGARHA